MTPPALGSRPEPLVRHGVPRVYTRAPVGGRRLRRGTLTLAPCPRAGLKGKANRPTKMATKILQPANGRVQVRIVIISSATLSLNLPETGQVSEMPNSKDMQEHPNDPMYYVQFGYLLNRAGSLGAASMSDVLKEFDIPLPIWQILLILSEFREQTISELASHTGIEMSYLSRTVLKAEKRGLVTRAKSAKDKRVTYIKLVTGGRQMIRKILPKTRLLRGIIFQGIPDADIETTARTLKVVYDNLASNADALSVNINRKLIVAQRTGKYGNRPKKI